MKEESLELQNTIKIKHQNIDDVTLKDPELIKVMKFLTHENKQLNECLEKDASNIIKQSKYDENLLKENDDLKI